MLCALFFTIYLSSIVYMTNAKRNIYISILTYFIYFRHLIAHARNMYILFNYFMYSSFLLKMFIYCFIIAMQNFTHASYTKIEIKYLPD